MVQLAIGQKVGYGRYRLVRQLGRGSFGDVFLAELLGPGGRKRHDVVIKVLHRRWAENREVVQRFQREWMAAMRVEHEHVARVIEHGLLEEDVPFICMEYLVGRSLRAELLLGALPPARAIALLCPVATALEAAHRSGVVHRDLKPDNVFLIERGGTPDFPVLLDFGMAKLLSDASQITKTGALLGTPVYMAPEQFRGERALGPAADVYAFGVIAFEVCTGKPPFLSQAFDALAQAHAEQRPPKLDGVPRALTRLVAACLAKEPAERPTAAALRQALQALLPPAPERPPVRHSRAHSVVASATGAAPIVPRGMTGAAPIVTPAASGASPMVAEPMSGAPTVVSRGATGAARTVAPASARSLPAPRARTLPMLLGIAAVAAVSLLVLLLAPQCAARRPPDLPVPVRR